MAHSRSFIRRLAPLFLIPIILGCQSEDRSVRNVLRIAHPLMFSGKESLDPASPTRFVYATVLLFNRLVRLDPMGRPTPELATGWEHNEDATHWRFKLRKDVRFHNGQPFTSVDAAYSLRHILDPQTHSPHSAILNIIERIESPSKYELTLVLSKPHAELPLLLSDSGIRMIPEGSASNIQSTGIGTGPFRLTHLDVAGTTRLTVNEDYWERVPRLDGIELIAIEDARSRLLALQGSQIDLVLEMSTQQASLFENAEQFHTQSFPTGEWTGLVMRIDLPPFQDVRVRKALRLLADRQEMIDLVLRGHGVVSCDTPVWTGDPYRWDGDASADVAEARHLLKEAGYPNGLDITLFTSDSMPQMIPLAVVYQQQAARAGVRVRIQQVPSAGYWTQVWRVKPFVVTFARQSSADRILNLSWRSGAPWNDSSWKDQRFDTLLDRARAELDFEKRRALYHQAQRILFEEGGTLIPFHRHKARVFSHEVSGLEPVPFFEIRWNRLRKQSLTRSRG